MIWTYFDNVAAAARTTTSAPRSPLIASRDMVEWDPTERTVGYPRRPYPGCLLFVFDLRLLYNLIAAVETVRRYTMAQVRLT